MARPVIRIVRHPNTSKNVDFVPLLEDPALDAAWVDVDQDWGTPDVLILPGSWNTMEDTVAFHAADGDARLAAYRDAGGVVLGICGGYQMLGQTLSDPHHLESKTVAAVPGIGWLPLATTFEPELMETTTELRGLIPELAGGPIVAREKRRGRSRLTVASDECRLEGPLGELQLLHEVVARTNRGETPGPRPRTEDEGLVDGLVSPDRRLWGTYVHELFQVERWKRGFLTAAMRAALARRS